MEYSLVELIDVEGKRKLLQSFHDAVGIPAAIVDLDGVVLVSSRWQRACTDFHRVNDITRNRCIESDTILANSLLEGRNYSLYRCKNGIMDAASPIIIEGKHLANMFIGQFFTAPPNMEYFRAQAKEFGLDEAEYLKAISEIPIIAEQSLPAILNFLTSSAVMIATLGIKHLQQVDTERELLNTQRDLKRAQRVAKTGSWRLNVQQNILHWSDETYNIFGVPRQQDMNYERFLASIHPEDLEAVDRAWKWALQGKPYEIEHRIIVGDAVKWVHEQAELEFADNGALIGGFGTVQDVTERKRTEEALKESETRYRSLFQNMSEGFAYCKMLFDADGNPTDFVYLDVNEAFSRLTGLKEVIGKRVSEVIPGIKEAHPEIFEIYARSALTGEATKFEFQFKPLNAWLSLSVYSPEKGYFVAVFDNITERKNAQDALRKSEARLRRFYESGMIGVLYYHLDGRITDANEKFLEMVGYTREDLRNGLIDWSKMTPLEYKEADDCAISQLLTSGVDTPYEKECIRKDGPRVPIIIGAAIIDEASHEGVAFVLDITERKKMEEELRKSHDELDLRVHERTAELSEALRRIEEANRDLEEFAFVASHDLQEPLRKIQTFLTMIQERSGDKLDENAQEYFRRVKDAADRMRQLILDLLLLSRVTTRPEPFSRVDLNVVANDILYIFTHRIQEGGGSIEITNLPTVEASEPQMKQLFQNIIGNALKFQKSGEKPRIKIYADLNYQDHCRIYFEDNGIGFEEMYLEKIFSPFQRLHDRSAPYEGTGMGLAICRKIVERHKGSITAKSEPGKGSTFIVTLPCPPPADDQSQAPHQG